MSDLERALLAVIGARTGRSGLAFARRPESLAGGYWAEISAFSLADPPRGFAGELVLRRMPDTPHARLEIAIHAAVAELGFATPRVRASGDSSGPLGRSFLIMDRARGETPDQLTHLLRRARRALRLPRLLAEAAARLHALPVEPLIARLRERGG
ncbi:MAG: phosphotransferase, partial [Myxococcota bacterium]